MRRLSCGLALILLASHPAPALAGWTYAEWGMMADTLVEASAGEAFRVEDHEDQRVLDQLHFAAAEIEQDGIGYKVGFYFDPKSKGLTIVDLEPVAADCTAAYAGLQERYGQGEVVRQVLEDNPRAQLVLTVTKWRSEGNEQIVQFTDVTMPPLENRFCKALYLVREM